MALPTFGPPPKGRKFDWLILGDDDEQTTRTFRARSHLTFDEQLEYNARKTMMTAEGAYAKRRRDAQLKEIDDDDPDALEKLAAYGTDARDFESQRYDQLVEMTLLLVDADDVDELRPLLEGADIQALQALRAWLEAAVIARTVKEVEEVAHVDPTLQPALSGSSDSPTSGDPST
jgi:hypothetical protein